jgi:nucleotide-binding universal stress UspA family protein
MIRRGARRHGRLRAPRVTVALAIEWRDGFLTSVARAVLEEIPVPVLAGG